MKTERFCGCIIFSADPAMDHTRGRNFVLNRKKKIAHFFAFAKLDLSPVYFSSSFPPRKNAAAAVYITVHKCGKIAMIITRCLYAVQIATILARLMAKKSPLLTKVDSADEILFFPFS